MAVTIEEMRAYAKGDDDWAAEDIALLEACMAAAVEWFKNAGVPAGTQSALYDLGIKMLTCSWFYNRGADSGVQLHMVPQGVYAIKHQLCDLPDAGKQTEVGAWPTSTPES